MLSYNISEDNYTEDFKRRKLFQVINIKDFHDCEKILLDFIIIRNQNFDKEKGKQKI